RAFLARRHQRGGPVPADQRAGRLRGHRHRRRREPGGARPAERHRGHDPLPDPVLMTHPVAALLSTLAIQPLASLVVTAPSVLAPVVAPSLGFVVDGVGLFVGLTLLSAMLSGLASGAWVACIAAVRVSQVAMIACAVATLAEVAGS